MAYKYHRDVIAYYKKWRKINCEKLKAKSRTRYAKNPAKEKKRHSLWVRNNRREVAKYMREWRSRFPNSISTSNRKHKLKIKLEVLDHYGDRCTCCGERNLKFLTLDHITKPRKMDRRENLWFYVRKIGFPKRFRIMCYNCNLGRDKNGGICPHKERRIK